MFSLFLITSGLSGVDEHIFSDIRVTIQFFGYRNIGTIRVFEGFGPISVSVSVNLVRFRFGFSVLVFLAKAIFLMFGRAFYGHAQWLFGPKKSVLVSLVA